MLSTPDLLEIVSGRKKGLLAIVIRCVLGLLTPFYRFAIWIRNRSFDRNHKTVNRVEVPVISIGNLTTGGTGKTPMVVWLAKYLRNKQLRVALISRGYGLENTGVGRNDEALELEHRLDDVPHLQSPNRSEVAKVAVEELETQVIVLDDGFQHRKLARDIDIVLIDAILPFGYGRLLPRGLLREPISSLSRAHAIVLTRCDAVDDDSKIRIKTEVDNANPNAIWAETKTVSNCLMQFDGTEFPTDHLSNQIGFAFCGIGNPAGFAHSLESCGLEIAEQKNFPDHHGYSREELTNIGDLAASHNAKAIICTHKDLVKVGVNRLGGIPVFALMIDIEFVVGEESLSRLLLKVSTRYKLDAQ